jgi:predicted hydrolase (HD superfamily)
LPATYGVEPRVASDYALPARPIADFDVGAAREALAKMSLDPMTGAALLRQIAEQTEPVNVAAVKEHLARAGKDYDTELAAAKFALDRAPGAIKPEQLDAHSLALLAIQGRRLAKHAAGRKS